MLIPSRIALCTNARQMSLVTMAVRASTICRSTTISVYLLKINNVENFHIIGNEIYHFVCEM